MLQVAQSAFIPPIFSSPGLGRNSIQAQSNPHPNFQTREPHEAQKPHDTPVPNTPTQTPGAQQPQEVAQTVPNPLIWEALRLGSSSLIHLL